jgi:large subunit ribosomal protein L30
MCKTYIEVKQIKSMIGQSKKQRLIMKSIGLKKIGQLKQLKNNAPIRGIITKMQHLLQVKVKKIL